MMLLGVVLMAAAPAPLSREPFMDEKAAAIALERQMDCLGGQAFARRTDKRPTKNVAADVVSACTQQSKDLRAALADVYRRKPNLLRSAKTPDEAADSYVAEMNRRTELVIQEGRQHK